MNVLATVTVQSLMGQCYPQIFIHTSEKLCSAAAETTGRV